MFRKSLILIGALLFAPFLAAAQAPPAPGLAAGEAQFLKSAEAFVRDLFAWGPDFKVKLGPLGQSPAPDFYVVPLQVTLNGQTDRGEVYVSKDGKTLLRGEMFDMAADPFAANRAKIHIEGNPSKGPANARVTLVEFSDFQCPHCRELYEELKTIETRYPQVRVVYKDFPLSQVHPWADTAAFGARCAFEQSPAAFWQVHDAIFDSQDLISAENVWEKLIQYASRAGLNTDVLKACMSSPGPRKAVEANRADGVSLNITSTPTSFINGHPLMGGDLTTLQQYIDFELASHPK